MLYMHNDKKVKYLASLQIVLELYVVSMVWTSLVKNDINIRLTEGVSPNIYMTCISV